MIRRVLFTAFMTCFALSANAQIATPNLDSGFHTFGAAATGWKTNSNFSIIGKDLKGDVENDATGEKTKVGDVKIGPSAAGPNDSAGLSPSLYGVYKGEAFAAELYTTIGDGLKTDIETEITAATTTLNTYKSEQELIANFSYVFADSLSIGIGYRNLVNKDKIENTNPVFQRIVNKELTTIETNITASWKLADIFYLAAGMESINQSGTNKTTNIFPVASETEQDFVDNSWANAVYGAGLMTGEPGKMQFRAEYSMKVSPESIKEAEGTKAASNHPQTTTSFATLEAKFGNILLAYFNKTEKEAEIDDNGEETNTVSNLIGLGWQPQEGLTVSVYSIDKKVTKTNSLLGETDIMPKGLILIVGWNF